MATLYDLSSLVSGHRGQRPHVCWNRTLRCLNGEPGLFHCGVRQPGSSECGSTAVGGGPIIAQSGSQIGRDGDRNGQTYGWRHPSRRRIT